MNRDRSMRDVAMADLRTTLVTEARRPFDDLCGALFLLTAAVSRARRNGVAASELEAIDAHTGTAIALARGLGESISTFMSAVESLLEATDGVGPIEIAVAAGKTDEIVVRVRTSKGDAVDVCFRAAM